MAGMSCAFFQFPESGLGATGRPCEEMRVTPEDLHRQAESWIRHWLAPKGSSEREAYAWATDIYDLEYHDPETLWRLILAIHARDRSPLIQQVLSAGPVEDLLAKHGATFIERVETQALEDPAFAKLLGGVWKNSMTDEVWQRLQAVWDRRGWDGIPE